MDPRRDPDGEIARDMGPLAWPPTIFRATPPGPATFTPSDYGTVWAHYAMRLETGYVTGDPIVQLTDHSGNGRHAIQTVPSRRASYKAVDANGLPAGEFDAANVQFYQCPSMSALAQASILVLLRSRNYPPTFQSETGFFRAGSLALNSHYSWTDSNIYVSFGSTNRLAIAPAAHGGNLTQWRAFGGRNDGSNQQYFMDASSIATGSAATFGFPTDVRMGGSDAYYFDGWIAEIVIWSNALSMTNHKNAATALRTFHGL